MSRWKPRAASSRSRAAWSASPWAAASRVRRGIGLGSITGRALRGKERSIPGIASTSVQRVFPDTIGAWRAELERRSQIGRLERGRAKSTGLFDPSWLPALDALEEMSGGMDCRYGRRLYPDLAAAGLVELRAEGRAHLIRGADDASGVAWLRPTVEKVRGDSSPTASTSR